MMAKKQQGLYHPEFERDNCGAGFICNLKGKRTNGIIHKALEILVRLEHRGAVSADGRTGDGAGILIEIPHALAALLPKASLMYSRSSSGRVGISRKGNSEPVYWQHGRSPNTTSAVLPCQRPLTSMFRVSPRPHLYIKDSSCLRTSTGTIWI